MKKEDIIQENNELRSRLLLAEKWMRREVATAIKHVQEEQYIKKGRKKLQNVLEEEHIDIITRRIFEIFGENLKNAPKYTLERLIDVEIYWSTLQQYPTMDALPIVLAYQKILDAWIEEKLISPWRFGFSPEKGRLRGVTQGGIHYSVTHPNPPFSGRGLEPLEKDLENILTRNYTLSIGRFYQILQIARGFADSSSLQDNTFVISSESFVALAKKEESRNLSPIVYSLLSFWQEYNNRLLTLLISDTFFLPFSELMDREIFSKKRHESKVTFSDAKRLRELFVGDNILDSLFPLLFTGEII